MTNHELSAWEKALAERLQQHTPDTPNGSWEALSARLDEELNAEDQQFDDLFKSKAEGFSATATPSDWSAFEKTLDAEETAFDDVLLEKLTNYEVPYNEAHWSDFERELDRHFTIIGYIKRYRILELAIILLLVVNIHTLGYRIPFPNWNDNFLPKTTLTQQSAQAAAGQNNLKKEARSTSADFAEAKTTAPLSNRSIGAALPATEANSSQPLTNINQFSQQVLTTLPTQRSELVSSVQPQQLPTIQAVPATNFIATLAASPLAAQPLELPALASSVANKSPWSIASHFALDVNQVMVPLDTIFQRPRDTIVSYGSGGGLSVGYQLPGRMRLSAGLQYRSVRYNPMVPLQKFGSFLSYALEEDFEGIHYRMIQVPVQMDYTVFQRGNFKTYLSFGAAANLIVTASYETRQEEIIAFSSQAIAPEVTERVHAQSRLERTYFPQGLGEGGDFNRNNYYSFNMGIGLEQRIHSSVALFLEPNYQRTIFTKGLGPTRDQIDRLSFNLGLRTFLR